MKFPDFFLLESGVFQDGKPILIKWICHVTKTSIKLENAGLFYENGEPFRVQGEDNNETKGVLNFSK